MLKWRQSCALCLAVQAMFLQSAGAVVNDDGSAEVVSGSVNSDVGCRPVIDVAHAVRQHGASPRRLPMHLGTIAIRTRSWWLSAARGGALALLGLVALGSAHVAAADHLVSPDVVRARMRDAALRRESDLTDLDRMLKTPDARAAARSLGVDGVVLSSGLRALDDQELHDLASRTQALESDPRAGMPTGILVTLIVVGSILLLGLTAIATGYSQ